MSRATTDLLDRLHGATAKLLLDKVEDGSATASEIAQAVKMLKDNGIDVTDAKDNPLEDLQSSLSDKLPFTNPKDPTVN